LILLSVRKNKLVPKTCLQTNWWSAAER